MTKAKKFRTETRGMTPTQVAKYLKAIAPGTFENPRLGKNFAKLTSALNSAAPSTALMERATKVYLTADFNESDNLHVGNSIANSTAVAQAKADREALSAHWKLPPGHPDRLTAKEVKMRKKRFRESDVEELSHPTAVQKTIVKRAHKNRQLAWRVKKFR